ncbi:MAG TPA: DUF1214 domain-containing protein [Rhizomicrobium sp.]|nr:DUF1214 domain-containing protein [Rhizomicrobium sp.]
MRIALKILAVVVIGAIIGLGLTWFTVFRGALAGGVSDGPWRTSLEAGSANGGMMLRARVAVHGLFALNRSEAIYYTAATDSNGTALSGACVYRIEGRDPPARWWSITAYGGDDYLIPNAAGIYSASMHSVKRDAGGRFAVTVSKAQMPGDWIPIGDGRFSLSIRLYNPQASVAAEPAHVALPTIIKARCT